ncbi:MAG: hypothetical protein V5788_01720 [Shewanella sp.]
MLIETLIAVCIFILVAGTAWGVINTSRFKDSDNREQGNSPTPKSTESNSKPSLAKPKKTPLLNPSAKVSQTIPLPNIGDLSFSKAGLFPGYGDGYAKMNGNGYVYVYLNLQQVAKLDESIVLSKGLIATLRLESDRLGSRSLTLEQARKLSKIANAIEEHATGEKKEVPVVINPVKRTHDYLPNSELQRMLNEKTPQTFYGTCKACDKPIEYCRCAG